MKCFDTLASTRIKAFIGIAIIAIMFLTTAIIFERKADTVAHESNDKDKYLDGLRAQQMRDCTQLDILFNLQHRNEFLACIQRAVPGIGFQGSNQALSPG